MTLFIVSIAVVLGVSAICSLSEASIYAVRTPFIRQLTESGSMAGRILATFKDNMERPISAILILNTAANTAGAAVAGAQARHLFGPEVLLMFSLAFTLAVLFFSEIIPKVLGVVYSRSISRAVSLPVAGVVAVLYPVIWLIERMSRLLKPNEPILAAPEDEVRHLAMMSAEEGSILKIEADLVQNVLKLNEVTAAAIMTPRSVVLKLNAQMTLREVAESVKEWTFSRIPIYDSEDPDQWVGVVCAGDILAGQAKDQFEVLLRSLSKPLHFVRDSTKGHVLLKQFLRRKSHLFGVVNEYGDIVGIVTLEDVMESLIGGEIVDEVDKAADMQEVAREQQKEQFSQGEGASEDHGAGSPHTSE